MNHDDDNSPVVLFFYFLKCAARISSPLYAPAVFFDIHHRRHLTSHLSQISEDDGSQLVIDHRHKALRREFFRKCSFLDNYCHAKQLRHRDEGLNYMYI